MMIDLFYNDRIFNYLRCEDCGVIYIDPIPNQDDFQKMYNYSSYHDVHYSVNNDSEYVSTDLSSVFTSNLAVGSTVLDYGCGNGELINNLKSIGYKCYGIEYTADAALAASIHTGEHVFNLSEFNFTSFGVKFDAIYLGDVLEHLHDPISVLRDLSLLLKDDGKFIIQGPLENSINFVSLIFHIYSIIKKYVLRINKIHASPTHLLRFNARQQKLVFQKAFPLHILHYWKVYDTGWPYNQGGLLKRLIAAISIWISGNTYFLSESGNRFIACFTVKKI